MIGEEMLVFIVTFGVISAVMTIWYLLFVAPLIDEFCRPWWESV